MIHDLSSIQMQRLIQLVWITQTALLLLISKFLIQSEFQTSAIIGVFSISVALIPVIARLKNRIIAANLFLTILTVLILLILWRVGGIKGSAIIGLPGILIFAAMTGATRFIFPIWLLMAGNIMLMGWVNQTGILIHSPPPTSVWSSFTVIVILGLISFAALSLAKDNTSLLVNLRKEVGKVEHSKQEIQHMAVHDHLTGLPNRVYAEEHFNRIVKQFSRKLEASATMLFIDLDEFKDINDALGHEIGDKFLIEMSSKLKSAIRSNDHVFRIGGDEFLVILDDIGSIDNIISISENLRLAANEIVEVGIEKLQCSASIGIVVLPKDATNYQDAVKRADIAMYRSKQQGKNCFHFYDESMEADLMEKYQLQQDMRSGIKLNQFFVEFQPIVNIATGKYVGAEALLRWQHPQKGLIPPLIFIPISEKINLIDDLCKFVLGEASEFVTDMHKLNTEFYVSINVSPIQLKESDLLQRILGDIPEVNFPFLKMELTESQIIENIDTYASNVYEFQRRGIEIFLDDFGTGYSNLGYLQRLKFETIKIDGSFTNKINTRYDKRPLIRAINHMATDLKINIVAEGVENEPELEVLKDMGVPFGQGYHWSKSVTKRSFIELAKENMSNTS